MSVRPQQPEPFIRGCLFPGFSDATYPRANPADLEHLSPDVWQAAQVPVGVRLEFVGDVEAVRISYQTTTANLGYRGEGAGCRFSAYRSGQKISEVEAVLGDGVVELPIAGEPSRPVIVYLPEGMRPIINQIEGIGGFIEPAPRQPRWLCYGDAITQGWLASSPSLAWPAVSARKLGLDLCNYGYAGSARIDTTTALGIADTPTDLVSISIGANNWGRFPHTPALCAEELKAMISLVRSRHHNAPIVVVSPFLRPEAEDTHNRLGATLTELRIAMEEAVRERMIAGDPRLYLVEGSTVVRAADLADGMYPGDDGHIRIAAAVGKMISPLMNELRSSAETRWAAEAASVLQLEMPQLPSTDFLRQVGTAEIGRMNAYAASAPAPAAASNGAVAHNGSAAVVANNPAAYQAPVAAPPAVPAQVPPVSVPAKMPVAQPPVPDLAAQELAAQQAAVQQVAALQQAALQQAAAQQAAAQQAAQQVAAQQAVEPQVPAPARGYETAEDLSQASQVPQTSPAAAVPAVPAAPTPAVPATPPVPPPVPVVTSALPPSPPAATALPPEATPDTGSFEAATFDLSPGPVPAVQIDTAAVTDENSWETEEIDWNEEVDRIDWSGEAKAADESFWSEEIGDSNNVDVVDFIGGVEASVVSCESVELIDWAEPTQLTESTESTESTELANQVNQESTFEPTSDHLEAEGSAPYPLLQAAKYLEHRTNGYPELGPEVSKVDDADGVQVSSGSAGAPDAEAEEAVPQWQ